eukprot:5382436-Pyramimonas_sp.AAC.1
MRSPILRSSQTLPRMIQDVSRWFSSYVEITDQDHQSRHRAFSSLASVEVDAAKETPPPLRR